MTESDLRRLIDAVVASGTREDLVALVRNLESQISEERGDREALREMGVRA